MMKNSPHDPTSLNRGPVDQTGRPLTYIELVCAMRAVLQIPAGEVRVMELEDKK